MLRDLVAPAPPLALLSSPAPPPLPRHLHSRPTAPAPPLPRHRSLLSSGRRWRAQVIAAVHYLHNINVIHRDIKPENLLFVETGDELNVKPADV